jgi:hypothetical protein
VPTNQLPSKLPDTSYVASNHNALWSIRLTSSTTKIFSQTHSAPEQPAHVNIRKLFSSFIHQTPKPQRF